MESPVFVKALGTGKWIGTLYVLDVCPGCGGKETFKVKGNGKLWGCNSCRKGGQSLAELRNFFSKDALLKDYVNTIVEPVKPEELIVVSEYHSPYKGKTIGTGFGSIDTVIGGLTEGALTILTGKRSEGKSTLMGQISLNCMEAKHNICFYSGELNAGRFQNWLFLQAAGSRNLECFEDQFGANRWNVKPDIEKRIREWLGDKLVLYDNTRVKSSERKTIMSAFEHARTYYGSDLFIIDNLMTARYDIDKESDANRAQANFASQAMDFARQNNVHVILVAHPKKGEIEDINDSVAGLGEITNMATNVIQVRKLNEEIKVKEGCDTLITISKNREHGETGTLKFNFDMPSKRFIPLTGTCISNYGWQKEVSS